MRQETTKQFINKHTVTFFDILGFKNNLKSKPLDIFAYSFENFNGFIRHILNLDDVKLTDWSVLSPFYLTRPLCHLYIFSDSIMLFSLDDSYNSCVKTLIASWQIYRALMAFGWNLRGCTTFGEMYINPNTNTFMGPALTDAYEKEQNQNWIGAMIDNTVIEQFPELERLLSGQPLNQGELFINNSFLKYDVPLKGASTIYRYVYNWRFNICIKNGLRSLFNYTEDKSANIKIDNTIDFLKHLKSNNIEGFLRFEKQPIEYNTIFVGDSDPPFKNWDREFF